MAAAVMRTKENNCAFSFCKTPVHTPIRHDVLSAAAALNDMAFHSNSSKHMNFVGTTNTNTLSMCVETMGKPIRLSRNRFTTPGFTQRHPALGSINHNSHTITQISSSDDLSSTTIIKELIPKQEKSIVLAAPVEKLNLSYEDDDDLPHPSTHANHGGDTYDDLIPADERIERFMTNQSNGVNMFAFPDANENRIRSQSPLRSTIDISTLVDILN